MDTQRLQQAIAEVREAIDTMSRALSELEQAVWFSSEPDQKSGSQPLHQVELWCDGGLHGPNPGSPLYGSYAFGDVKETVEFGVSGSNNEAEYLALLAGLEAISKAYNPAIVYVTIKTDSDLVRLQVLGAWKAKAEHLRRLRNKVQRKLDDFGDFRFQHVPRADIVAMLGH